MIAAVQSKMTETWVAELYASTANDTIFEFLLHAEIVLLPWTFGIGGHVYHRSFGVVWIDGIPPITGACIALANAVAYLWTKDDVAHHSLSLAAEAQTGHEGNVDVIHVADVRVGATLRDFFPSLT